MDNLKDLVDYGVLGLLGLLSVIALALVLERIYFFRKIDITKYGNKKTLEIDLGANLTIIATIGSNAPYIGLLGTVGGIIITFMEIGGQDLTNTQAIMSGLALALKATGFGLILAIPSIVSYNLLARKAEVLLMRFELLESDFPPHEVKGDGEKT